ncbi:MULTISPECIES: DUF1240 domain-containing protein [Photorhabdus]
MFWMSPNVYVRDIKLCD